MEWVVGHDMFDYSGWPYRGRVGLQVGSQDVLAIDVKGHYDECKGQILEIEELTITFPHVPKPDSKWLVMSVDEGEVLCRKILDAVAAVKHAKAYRMLGEKKEEEASVTKDNPAP